MCNLRDRIIIDMYGLEHNWVFNPYREVDEIADEDSDDVPYFDPDYDWEDYTDADAQLDNDYRDYEDE